MKENASYGDTGIKTSLHEVIAGDATSFGTLDFSAWIYEGHSIAEWRALGAKYFAKTIFSIALSSVLNEIPVRDDQPKMWSMYVRLIEQIANERESHQWERSLVLFMKRIGFTHGEIGGGIFECLKEIKIEGADEEKKVKQAFRLALRTIAPGVM